MSDLLFPLLPMTCRPSSWRLCPFAISQTYTVLAPNFDWSQLIPISDGWAPSSTRRTPRSKPDPSSPLSKAPLSIQSPPKTRNKKKTLAPRPRPSAHAMSSHTSPNCRVTDGEVKAQFPDLVLAKPPSVSSVHKVQGAWRKRALII